jgi:hypothetical protein
MKIAILKESAPGETRCAAIPETVKKFTALGAEVAVESGAGNSALISDAEFEAAGARTGSRAEVLKGAGAILCVNPITGVRDGAAPASANLGTLKPNEDLTGGELVPGAVPARCDARGLLLIGDPPELGPYVLPGNNYHVYDIPLFWANLRADAAARVKAWKPGA